MSTQSVVVLALALGVAGCVSVSPPPKFLGSAEIGPPPQGYDAAIKDQIGRTLIDPYTAVYEIGPPVRGWGWAHDGAPPIFWAVCGTVNAKNRFGGYVGRRPFVALFAHGQVARTLIAQREDSAVPQNMCDAWYAESRRAWR